MNMKEKEALEETRRATAEFIRTRSAEDVRMGYTSDFWHKPILLEVDDVECLPDYESGYYHDCYKSMAGLKRSLRAMVKQGGFRNSEIAAWVHSPYEWGGRKFDEYRLYFYTRKALL